MRNIETTIYTIDELNEKAKERALDWLREGVDAQWSWECMQEDAKTVGIRLVEWDYCRHCEVEFNEHPLTVANLIIDNHGADCDTYKAARAFLATYCDGEAISGDDNDDAKNELERELAECYRIMLDNDYDYQNGEEALLETCAANGYEFTEAGAPC